MVTTRTKQKSNTKRKPTTRKRVPIKKKNIIEKTPLLYKKRKVNDNKSNSILHEHKVNDLIQEEMTTTVDTSQVHDAMIMMGSTLMNEDTRKPLKKRRHAHESMHNNPMQKHNANGLIQRKITITVGTKPPTSFKISDDQVPMIKKTRKPYSKRKPVDESKRKISIRKNKVTGLIQKETAATTSTGQRSGSKSLRKLASLADDTLRPRRKMKPVDETTRNLILHESHVNGLTQRKIADKVGISKSTVCNILIEHALSTGNTLKPRSKGKVVDDDMRDTILNEHNINGLSQKQIADMVGISQMNVSIILKEHTLSTGNNLKPCKKGKRVDDNLRSLVLHEHIANGLTNIQIAEMFDISKSSVSNILMKHALSTDNAYEIRGRKKLVDEKTRNRILHERTTNGLSQKEIANIVGTSHITVSKILNEYTIRTTKDRKPYSKGRRVDEDMRNAIVHEYNVNHLTQKQIATKVGTSHTTVSKIVIEHALSTGKILKPRKKRKIFAEKLRHPILLESKVNDLNQPKSVNRSDDDSLAVSPTLRTSKENVTLEPIRDKWRRSKITEKDKLELTREWEHNPSQTMEELRMTMMNPPAKTTFYKLIEELKLSP